ncbi:MAG: hypothetical protein KC486_10835, partial [Myxococcales bacterium]|nr:hypothetical protein [Myxococcales bacterium]
MRRSVAPVALTCLFGLTLAACGDDTVVGASATESGGETSTSTSTGPSETTGGDGLCVQDSQCEDDNACTANRCGADGICIVDPVLSNACRPQIDVDFPPRGATLTGAPGKPVVTVTGKVTSGAGAIDSLTLNDQAVAVAADGTFSADVVVGPGGHTLDLHATDEFGATRRRVQSFLWSTEYRKPETVGEQMVPEGIAFYLSQEALDDGDNSEPADDIASVLGIALASFDIAALLDPDTPITHNAGYDIYLTSMEFGSTQVSLAGIDGGLHLGAAIQDVVGDL